MLTSSQKQLLSFFLLFILVFASLLSPAAAALQESGDLETAAEEPKSSETANEDKTDTIPLFLSKDELDRMLSDYMSEYKIKEDRISISYYYPETGESWEYNSNAFNSAASLYKLPLMMGLAQKVSAGELTQDSYVMNMKVSYIEKRAITYSDNAVSEAVIPYFGTFREYRLMLVDFAGYNAADLPDEFFSQNVVSTDLMMGILKKLYYNQDQFPNIIDCMLDANPGHYLKKNLEGTYPIAQKYGGGEQILNGAGIVYTPNPFLIVIMTHNVAYSEYVLGDLTEMFANYTLTLDKRAEEFREQEAERKIQEEREEEQRRLEAEERIRQEEERQRAIQAAEDAKRAEEEAAAAAHAAEKAASLRFLHIILAFSALLISMSIIFIFRKLLSKSKK